jgi:hypothetical protein
MSYTWKWQLDERGYSEVPFKDYTEWQSKVNDYVEKYLSPSIENANCGWDHCVYYVLKNQYDTNEFVALYPDKENQNGRYINVGGNSLGAIAEATWNSVYR